MIIWCSLFLAVAILVIGLIIVLLVLRSRGGNRKTSSSQPRMPMTERAARFEKRNRKFQEEQNRILGMVAAGKITPEEGDRLLDSLERETSSMACPFCNEDIRFEAVRCKHCGSYLYEGISGPKRLTKSNDKMLAGVCGGIAEYFELDPTMVRVLVALIVFFSGIIVGLIVYLVTAMILPNPESCAVRLEKRPSI